MPTEHLPYSGFENIQPATSEPEAIATNSLAACAPKPVLVFVIPLGLKLPSGTMSDRIHEPDPLLFSSSFEFQWIASSDNRDKNAGFCNCEPIHAPSPRVVLALHTNSHGGSLLCLRLWCWADDWPAAPLPRAPPTANINGTVSVDGLAWVYVWDE